jgi:uncharacterized protein with HEPN domain
MKNEDKIYLKHIIGEISKIEITLQNKKEEEFKKDVDIQDAIVRRIEIIGEAVKNISQKLKDKNPEVEWKKIAGTRDVLIHAYFSIDLDLLWGIVNKNIPILKAQISKLLKSSK